MSTLRLELIRPQYRSTILKSKSKNHQKIKIKSLLNSLCKNKAPFECRSGGDHRQTVT